jgi:hypothetical protein
MSTVDQKSAKTLYVISGVNTSITIAALAIAAVALINNGNSECEVRNDDASSNSNAAALTTLMEMTKKADAESDANRVVNGISTMVTGRPFCTETDENWDACMNLVATAQNLVYDEKRADYGVAGVTAETISNKIENGNYQETIMSNSYDTEGRRIRRDNHAVIEHNVVANASNTGAYTLSFDNTGKLLMTDTIRAMNLGQDIIDGIESSFDDCDYIWRDTSCLSFVYLSKGRRVRRGFSIKVDAVIPIVHLVDAKVEIYIEGGRRRLRRRNVDPTDSHRDRRDYYYAAPGGSKALGGCGTGAGVGGAIGTAFGPGVGTAVGAGIGCVVGAAASGLRNTNDD